MWEHSKLDVANRSKPFKVFLSLLDRWEIGVALTDALCLQALQSLRSFLTVETPSEDLVIASRMLISGLDPFLLWRKLFQAVAGTMQGKDSSTDGLEICAFVARTFELEEEEVCRIHVPLLFLAITDLIEVSIWPLDGHD